MKTPFPALEKEARVEIGGRSHTFLGIEPAGLVFRDDVTGDTTTHDAKSLVRAYRAGRFEMPPQVYAGLPVALRERLRLDLRHLPEAAQATAMHRVFFCQAVDRLTRDRPGGRRPIAQVDAEFDRMARIAAGVKGCRRPGGSTLRRWYRLWTRSGRCPVALANLDDRKGRRPKTFPPIVRHTAAKLALDHHLQRESLSVEALHVLLEQEIEGLNTPNGASFEVPTVKQLRVLIDRSFTAEERAKLKDGGRNAAAAYSAKRRRKTPERLLSVIQIDHVLLDCIATRERTGVPLETEEDAPKLKRGIAGRVWVTVAICTTSRCIVGWSLSLDAPSYVSVLKCLRHVMTPKEDLVLADGTVVENPCWGKPKVVFVDNGPEFHSLSLKIAATYLNFELRYSKARHPWERGIVERLFRDTQREVANVAGKTFSDTKLKSDYDSTGLAHLTTPEIERRFALFAVALHRHRDHRGLRGLTPAEAWEEAAGLGIDWPPDADTVALMTRRVLRQARLRDIGIEHLGLRWNSAAFNELLRREGHRKSYVVTVDPLDLTEVTLIEETPQGPTFHKGTVDLPDLVTGMDLDMWERTYNRARERTPANRRSTKAILYQARRELAETARERDLAGKHLPKEQAKFAEMAARQEAERRKAARETREASEVLAPEDGRMPARPPSDLPRRQPGSIARRSLEFA